MRVVWACFLLLAGVSPVAGQSPDSVLAPLVPKSSMVRLASGPGRVTGHLLALTAGVATLETKAGNVTTNLATVDSIWVQGRATKTGAIIGGITGSILFGVFVGYVVQNLCEVDCEGAWLKGGLVGGALGVAGGALLGAGIGALIPKWRLRFP